MSLKNELGTDAGVMMERGGLRKILVDLGVYVRKMSWHRARGDMVIHQILHTAPVSLSAKTDIIGQEVAHQYPLHRGMGTAVTRVARTTRGLCLPALSLWRPGTRIARRTSPNRNLLLRAA